ncbi:MAG: DUF1761 domain-containing protein [Saprospiraceae bacterium]|nr:DUF1761 domain-containing protein [Saprospiraceae bacterium]
MKRLRINHAAVWVCIVLAQIIPLLWYTALGSQWMAANELSQEFIEENQNIGPYIVSILASIVSMYVLAMIFRRMEIESARSGATTGLLIGIAFNTLSIITINVFSFRPLVLAVIDGGVNAVVFLVAGAILGGWRKYA